MGGTHGRALHLLDVEYLGLGPRLSADARSLAESVDRVVDLTVGHAPAA